MAHDRHLLDRPHRLEDRHDQDMLVRVGRVFDEALPPTSRPLGADAPQAFERIAGVGDRLLELLGRFDPGHDHAVGADVERPLDQAAVEFRDADQRDRLASDGRAEVFHDIFPIEMAVFGVDDHPVEPQRDRHFRNAGRLQRDPQTEHSLVGGQFATEATDGGGLHKAALTRCGEANRSIGGWLS